MLIRVSEYMAPVRSLSKPHKGIVVDNNDPKKLGRVRCTIAGIYEGNKSDLPWIGNPSNPNSMTVPDIGEELKIVFPFNDIYSPEIGGYYHSTKNTNADFDTDYPNTFGLSVNGLKALHNSKTDQTDIIHPSGDTLQVVKDGTLTLNMAKDLILNIKGDYTITGEGKIIFTAKADVGVTTDGKVSLSGKGGVNIASDATAKLIGKGGTTVGDASGLTKVDGSTLMLAGGGLPIAMLTSDVIGTGNLGAPVMSKVIVGSSKVLAPL